MSHSHPQVAIHIRRFCDTFDEEFGAKLKSVNDGSGKNSPKDGAVALERVKTFVAAQAKSLFKLEKSLCHQTIPKCPIELLRTQFFIKVGPSFLQQ